MPEFVDEIIQALKNLGGEGTLKEIFTELEQNRSPSSPKPWPTKIKQTLEFNSSDTQGFRGSDIFHRVKNGIWALRNYDGLKEALTRIQLNKIKKHQEYSDTESFEAISNRIKTIKEYRDYYDPASPTWSDYVDEFFHIMGFSIENKEDRISLLREMGGKNEPKAIVCIITPGENFEEILPRLNWKYYLLLSADYYKVKYAILTNGLQLKVFHNIIYKYHLSHTDYWPNLDEIICDLRIGEYVYLHKVFSEIRNYEVKLEQELS